MSDKQEFRTVDTNGSTPHVIPVEYMEKGKVSYEEIKQKHKDLEDLKYRWRKGGIEGATTEYDENLNQEVLKKSEEFDKLFTKYEKQQNKYKLPDKEIKDGREKYKIKDENGKITDNRLEKLDIYGRQINSLYKEYEIGINKNGNRVKIDMLNPVGTRIGKGEKGLTRIYVQDVRRLGKNYVDRVQHLFHEDFKTDKFNELIDYLADNKLIELNKANNSYILQSQRLEQGNKY